MKKLKCLIVDDEELARRLLEAYIAKLNFLQVVGSVENAAEAINVLHDLNVDILFLDIQMPDVKGTDLARMVPSTTKVIFTTAYSEYALEGFELNALDYLLKPITFKRFMIAVNKANDLVDANDFEEVITVKSGYDLHKLNLGDIIYIESSSEYVIFYTASQKIMSYQTLKSLEETLPNTMFMRVHRSFIVNRKKITAMKGKDLFIGDIKIPVSLSYYELVKQQLF